MRNTRTRLGLVAVSALAIGVIAGPVGSAQAAKVTSTAAGGPVPELFDPAVGASVSTPFVQTFELKGGKVKKKQTLDVDVTINSAGNLAGANADLSAVLFGPSGDAVGLDVPGFGSAIVGLKLDSQSPLLQYCNPLVEISDDCNYLQGGNPAGTIGTITGSQNDALNPSFKGGNPKGTWKIAWRDTDADAVPVTSTVGTTTLEVKTGKKFAKE